MAEKELPESVKDVMDIIIGQKWCELADCANDCESPIEQLMAIALNDVRNQRSTFLKEFKRNLSIVDIIPQDINKMKSGKTYILDFAIPVWNTASNCGQIFAIECDGHSFHEKTKEQVRSDKIRERELTAAGFIVIRFSGSEIYDNPFKCASEVFDIIFKHFDRVTNGGAA